MKLWELYLFMGRGMMTEVMTEETAKHMITEGFVLLNGEKVTDPEREITLKDRVTPTAFVVPKDKIKPVDPADAPGGRTQFTPEEVQKEHRRVERMRQERILMDETGEKFEEYCLAHPIQMDLSKVVQINNDMIIIFQRLFAIEAKSEEAQELRKKLSSMTADMVLTYVKRVISTANNVVDPELRWYFRGIYLNELGTFVSHRLADMLTPRNEDDPMSVPVRPISNPSHEPTPDELADKFSLEGERDNA